MKRYSVFIFLLMCVSVRGQSGEVVADDGHGVIIIHTQNPDNPFIAITNFQKEATFRKFISARGTKTGAVYRYGDLPLQLWDASIPSNITNKIPQNAIPGMPPQTIYKDVIDADSKVISLVNESQRFTGELTAVRKSMNYRIAHGLTPLLSDATRVNQLEAQIGQINQQLMIARQEDLKVRQAHNLPPLQR